MSAKHLCPCCGQTLPDVFADLAVEVGMSKNQTALFLAVAAGNGKPVTYAKIENAIWGDDPDGGPLTTRNVIMVQRTRINALIGPRGYRLVNQYGVGFRLQTIIAEAA